MSMEVLPVLVFKPILSNCWQLYLMKRRPYVKDIHVTFGWVYNPTGRWVFNPTVGFPDEIVIVGSIYMKN
jgi:hypothetical protein